MIAMENSEAHMEQIRRNILEKLRRRFSQMEQGNTERFDRVLAQWIDLNRAILLREKSEDPKGDHAPWESSDKSVGDAWESSPIQTTCSRWRVCSTSYRKVRRWSWRERPCNFAGSATPANRARKIAAPARRSAKPER